MQRPIEFRAWDIKNKKMYPVLLINFDYQDVIVGRYQNSDSNDSSFDEHALRFGECELMQDAGILDAAGKKIFEGDIIDKIAYNGKEHHMTGEVIYYRGGFCLKIIRCNNDPNDSMIGNKYPFDCFSWVKDNKLNKFHILGNKFEHRHLMDNKLDD